MLVTLYRGIYSARDTLCTDVLHAFNRYGIGLVLFKQERFAQAESHFKKALSIHPHSSVLMCHVAVVSMVIIFYISPVHIVPGISRVNVKTSHWPGGLFLNFYSLHLYQLDLPSVYLVVHLFTFAVYE